MSLRDDLIANLRRDKIPFVEEEDAIRVPPRDETGFEVVLTREEDGAIVVGFGEWHDHCGTPEEALQLFGLGLSDACRVHVESRGGKDHAWTMEWWDPTKGAWVRESQVAHLGRGVFGRKSARYLQNRWISKEAMMERKRDFDASRQ